MKRVICVVLMVLLVVMLFTSCGVAAVNASNGGANLTTQQKAEVAAAAQSAQQAQAAQAGGGWTSWIFIIILIVVFVVLIIVPNKRRDKKYKEMLSNIKIGSAVKTIGGVYGKVIAIKEDLVTIETGPDKAKIVFTKSAIATIDSMDVEAEEGSKGIEKK